MAFYTHCAKCGTKVEAWDKDLSHAHYCFDCSADEPETIDTTPLCWICGDVMEWTGQFREIPLDGGFAGIVEDPIYACYNPECPGDDEDGDE